MAQIFITYFSVLILYTVLLYLIGFIAFKSVKIQIAKPYTNHFARWMAGLNIFIIITALYFTKGITVMIFLLPFIFYFLFKYKDTSNDKQVNDETDDKYPFLKFIIFTCIGALLLFLFRFGQIYNSGYCIPSVPSGDMVFYSNCIDFLTHFGNENSTLDYIYPKGVNPYHYYELWQSGGFSCLLGLNTSLTLVMVTFSIANIIIWMGITAILEQYKKVETIDLILCFFLVFTTSFVFSIYTKVHFMSDIFVYSLNTFTILKFYPNYIFIIAAVLFFINKKSDDAIICLLVLPVVHIGNALSIYPAIIIWYAIEFIRTKKINYTNVLFCLLSAFCIMGFYKILPQAESHVSAHFTDILTVASTFLYWKTAFNIIAGSTIQFNLIFLPFILFYFLNFGFKSILIREMILVGLIYFISLSGWALLNYKLSSTQIFSNISLNMLTILSIVIVILVWVKKERTLFRNIMLLIVFIVGVINSTNNYYFGYAQSDKYLTSIKAESKNLSTVGVYLRSKDEYNFTFSYVGALAILGKYLIYFDNKSFPLSLSVYDYPYSENPQLAQIERETIATSPFYKYVEAQKSKGEFVSVEKSQMRFIEEHKINYLICTKNVTLSGSLQQKVRKMIVDENTGERFYLLK